MTDSPGQAGLALVDQVIAARPHKDDYVLADAMERLCEYRDQLIAQTRRLDTQAHDRDRLERLNAVLSVVAGVHFPLGETPWDELTKARGWLAALLEES